MRSLASARTSWQELQHYKTLQELKEAVRLDGTTSIATSGLRSASWKAFLLFETLDVDEWQRTLASSRSAYNSLRAHFFRLVDNQDDFGTGDPLSSQDAENSPWTQRHKDEELRAEILQDVERCMLEFTRTPETQRMLVDILWVFCKLNPDVGYRQGMHEIAASILWVVQDDALDLGESSKVLGEDGIIRTIFDADHIEHDSFALFGQVMQNAKPFYLSEGPLSIAARSRHIFDDLLVQIDPILKNHLDGLDIVPQVFLIRWIRLLFGREFEFESVLALWDVLFAEDPSLELVEHICLAMLLRIRWHLLDSDYNNALSLLLRYPELDKDLPAQVLGLDALYLKNHMSRDGSSYIVLKHTGRPLKDRPTTPPALQRNITTFSGINAGRHAGRIGFSPPAGRQARGIEALQNTAKNIYAQGEKLGIGKAVRNAVDEVQRKAQELRDAQAPSPPPWRRSGNIRLLDNLKDIEARNRRLAELLSEAVNELWGYQALVSQQGASTQQTDSIERLSTAIAKVQFVQVYLNEPTLVLPEEESRIRSRERVARPFSQSTSSETLGGQSDAPSFDKKRSSTRSADVRAKPLDLEEFTKAGDDQVRASQQDRAAAFGDEKGKPETTGEPAAAQPVRSHAVRPSLEQSAFSFMLGQEEKPGAEAKKPPMASDRTEGSLFGYCEQDRSRTSSPRPANSKTVGQETQQEEFDFGSLRLGKRGQKK